MANPGSIIPGREQMLKGGMSQPRNKGLFKMFNLIGLGEHAGSGVPDIFKAWRDEKLDDPIVDEKSGRDGNPTRTTLTLPLTSYVTNSTTNPTTSGTVSGAAGGTADRVDELLDFCREPRTKNEIQEFLNIKSTRYLREKLINPLLKEGRLFRTIPDKPSSPNQKYYSKA